MLYECQFFTNLDLLLPLTPFSDSLNFKFCTSLHLMILPFRITKSTQSYWCYSCFLYSSKQRAEELHRLRLGVACWPVFQTSNAIHTMVDTEQAWRSITIHKIYGYFDDIPSCLSFVPVFYATHSFDVFPEFFGALLAVCDFVQLASSSFRCNVR